MMVAGNDFERRVETAVEMAKLTAAVVANTESTNKIRTAMFGEDDEGGLVTQVALTKQSVSRLWKWTTAMSATLLGLAAWVLRGAFK